MRILISLSQEENKEWWERLTEKEREEYLEKHPNSKFAADRPVKDLPREKKAGLGDYFKKKYDSGVHKLLDPQHNYGIAAAADEVEVSLKLIGKPECVERVMSLLGMIAFNGAIGHSGIFGISWDGDGSDKIKVEGDLPDHRDAWNACTNYGGYAEFMGESGKSYVISGKDISTKRVWPKDESK